jgi:hypothetical protein
MAALTLSPTARGIGETGIDAAKATLSAGLNLPTPANPQPAADQAELSFSAVFGPNFSELRVPAIAQVVVDIFQQSASEQEELKAQIEAWNRNQPASNSPLAAVSLAPQALLNVSIVSQESPPSNASAALAQLISTQVVGQSSDGRVDGVLLPDLVSVLDVVHSSASPLESMVAPFGNIIRSIRLQSADQAAAASLAA